jgi:hypothetical protein
MPSVRYDPPLPKTGEFADTFARLRKILKPYARHFTVKTDTPTAYYLFCKTATTRTGSPIAFGGVEIKKNYVSFHLIPVYANPKLVDTLSPALRKRMQGKSCFNFTAIDPAQVKELAAVTKKGFPGFVKQFP